MAASCYELRELVKDGCPNKRCIWAKGRARPEPCRCAIPKNAADKPLPKGRVSFYAMRKIRRE